MSGDDAVRRERRGPGVRAVRTFAEEQARIVQALDQTALQVGRMPSTALTRDLSCRIDSYRRAIDGWAARQPTAEEAQLLRLGIEETWALARMNAPTVRIVSRR